MKTEITIPTSLNEISLEQYQRFLKSSEGSNDSEFIKYKMIEIFCLVPLKHVALMKQIDIDNIVESINKLFLEKQKLTQVFQIQLPRVTFGFIPNLENISGAEFADLEQHMSNWETMHKAMAVLYRPIKEMKDDKYTIEDYNGTATYGDVMKLMPVSIALGASLFFYDLGKELSMITLQSSMNEMKTSKN